MILQSFKSPGQDWIWSYFSTLCGIGVITGVALSLVAFMFFAKRMKPT